MQNHSTHQSVSALCRTMLFLVCLSACDNPTRHKAIAEQGSSQLHTQIEHQQYREAYLAADAALRQAVTETQATSLLSSVHDCLGHCKKTTLRDYMAIRRVEGFTKHVADDSIFDKGEAVERLVWRIQRDTAGPVGYNITSTALPNGHQ